MGFCATRPPGHHARTDTTSGFCLFNHVAVAIRHALDSLGARRVFIFDWDLHHGDGTNDIFRTTNAVLYASIHQSGAFPGTGRITDAGARAGEGYSINLPVQKGSYEDAWLSLLEHIVIPAAEEFEPDLVLISAGYDAHREDRQGGCQLEASSFAEMARHIRGAGRTDRRASGRRAGGWIRARRARRLGMRHDGGTRRRSASELRCAGLPHLPSRIPRRVSLEIVNQRNPGENRPC